MKRVKEPLSLERQQEKQQKHKAEPHSLDSALKRAPRDISRSSPSYDAQTRLTWTGEVARYSHLASSPFLPLPFSSPARTISSLRTCARNRKGTRTNPTTRRNPRNIIRFKFEEWKSHKNVYIKIICKLYADSVVIQPKSFQGKSPGRFTWEG